MSPFPHILPMAEPGAPRAGGERQNASAAAAGVAGVFAELMAQALSPGLPPSNESIETPGQTTAETSDKEQDLLPEQPVKTPSLHFKKIPLQVVPVPEAVRNAIRATVAPLKPAVQSKAVESNCGAETVTKAGENTNGTVKSDKNSQPQSVPPGVGPVPNELLINQIIAGTMSTAGRISNPPVKLELNPVSSAPERAAAPDDGVAGISVAAQTRKTSGTFTNGLTSNLLENETIAASEPSAAPATGRLTAESAATNEQNTVLRDTLANFADAKPTVNSAEYESANQSMPSGQPVTQTSSDFSGIPIAKQDLSVKQAEKTNNIAGQTEKVLPGNSVSMAQANRALPISSHPELIAAAAPVSSDAVESLNATAAPAIHSAVMVSASNAPAVERIQELVTFNAVRLSDSGNSSMQVVIKPDSGTQLSLELRQHESGVEVQAVLQQGDFHHLSQQWPELQQRLGQRGIQLAPLAGDATGANAGGAGSFRQHQQTAEPVVEDYFAGPPARQILPAIAHAPVIALAQEQRGWETWA